ncbi:MAG TPA: hypothetical protein VFR81_03380 [Longimicrobium sp.]|nr:hypothetical protein [Longimicrobium sp.]
MPYVLRLSEETQEQIAEFLDTVPPDEHTVALDAIFIELMKIADDPRTASHAGALTPCHHFPVRLAGRMRPVSATFVYASDEKHLNLVEFRELEPWEWARDVLDP